jgi:hypothetical protein
MSKTKVATIKLSEHNVEWEAYLVPQASDGLLTDGKVNWGTTHFKSKKIYVDNSLDDEDIYEVLVHELTHAVLFETQVKEVKKYNEEDVCEMMGMYGKIIIDLAEEVLKQWYLDSPGGTDV